MEIKLFFEDLEINRAFSQLKDHLKSIDEIEIKLIETPGGKKAIESTILVAFIQLGGTVLTALVSVIVAIYSLENKSPKRIIIKIKNDVEISFPLKISKKKLDGFISEVISKNKEIEYISVE
jgi:hypothetical protein